MAYCLQADIEKRISAADVVSLTDDTQTGAVNTVILAEAITQADDRIDSSLRGRFTVPLTTVPGMIKAISVDLAVYHLYTRRPAIEFPKAITNRFNDALRQLSEIAAGTLQIFSATDSALANFAGDILCNKEESDRVFNSDTLDLF